MLHWSATVRGAAAVAGRPSNLWRWRCAIATEWPSGCGRKGRFKGGVSKNHAEFRINAR
jgi:hypothetical protein